MLDDWNGCGGDSVLGCDGTEAGCKCLTHSGNCAAAQVTRADWDRLIDRDPVEAWRLGAEEMEYRQAMRCCDEIERREIGRREPLEAAGVFALAAVALAWLLAVILWS